MEQSTQKRFIGHKIWYTIAIILCSLVLLISLVGVFGTWAAEQALARFSVTLLRAAENTAGGLRQVIERVDTNITRLTSLTNTVSQTSSQISQNVDDTGLLLTLLSQEKETELVGFVSSTVDSINNIRDTLRGGIDLYRSINDMPFIKLPMPNEERVQQLTQTMAQVEATLQELRQSVQDFRAGVTSKIELITQLAENATQKLTEVSGNLTQLDTELANLQATAVELQVVIPNLLALVAFIVTLFLAFIVYTQVEMVILYVKRWKALGGGEAIALEATQVYQLPAGEKSELTEAVQPAGPSQAAKDEKPPALPDEPLTPA